MQQAVEAQLFLTRGRCFKPGHEGWAKILSQFRAADLAGGMCVRISSTPVRLSALCSVANVRAAVASSPCTRLQVSSASALSLSTGCKEQVMLILLSCDGSGRSFSCSQFASVVP